MTPSEQPAALTRAADQIRISVAQTFDDFARVIAVRAAVYMAEQACPFAEEFDGNDFTATHILGYVGDEPAGCLRLRYFGGFAKLERVAVRKEFRQTRVAFRMVRWTIEFLRRKGYATIHGHAREQLVPFWRRFGFVAVAGRPTFAFSDHPYVEMRLDLGEAAEPIGLGADPYVLNRPEGGWDEPGVLERSAERGIAAREQ